jgi:hypothetical protein
VSAAGDARVVLPELPLDAWEPTKNTLHLWAQIVGKVQLATTAPRNHWWNVTFAVGVRGLTTRLMHAHGRTFQIDFDFVDDRLVLRTGDGDVDSFALEDGLSVAQFDVKLHELLTRAGVDVAINEEPFGIAHLTTPFAQDTEHRAYDRDYVVRYWRALDWIGAVFEEFAGWFCGKTSPVQLFWHSLDLAVTRFSGRRAPKLDGADPVTREAYSHEAISFGFWPGDPNLGQAAFYSYTAPEPPGLREQPLVPAEASWIEMPTGSLALLPYDAVRTAADPRAMLLAFLQSGYDAGTEAAGWDRAELESAWCPSARQLEEIVLRVGRG